MELECVLFRLGNEQYAHCVGVVTEVIVYLVPVPVPGAHTEVEGVINVRGSVIPVISGRKLFELGSTIPNCDWRIILLETPHGRYGVSVDAVGEIIRFSEDNITDSDKMSDPKLVKGTVQHELGLLILTDFNEVGVKQENFE